MIKAAVKNHNARTDMNKSRAHCYMLFLKDIQCDDVLQQFLTVLADDPLINRDPHQAYVVKMDIVVHPDVFSVLATAIGPIDEYPAGLHPDQCRQAIVDILDSWEEFMPDTPSFASMRSGLDAAVYGNADAMHLKTKFLTLEVVLRSFGVRFSFDDGQEESEVKAVIDFSSAWITHLDGRWATATPPVKRDGATTPLPLCGHFHQIRRDLRASMTTEEDGDDGPVDDGMAADFIRATSVANSWPLPPFIDSLRKWEEDIDDQAGGQTEPARNTQISDGHSEEGAEDGDSKKMASSEGSKKKKSSNKKTDHKASKKEASSEGGKKKESARDSKKMGSSEGSKKKKSSKKNTAQKASKREASSGGGKKKESAGDSKKMASTEGSKKTKSSKKKTVHKASKKNVKAGMVDEAKAMDPSSMLGRSVQGASYLPA